MMIRRGGQSCAQAGGVRSYGVKWPPAGIHPGLAGASQDLMRLARAPTGIRRVPSSSSRSIPTARTSRSSGIQCWLISSWKGLLTVTTFPSSGADGFCPPPRKTTGGWNRRNESERSRSFGLHRLRRRRLGKKRAVDLLYCCDDVVQVGVGPFWTDVEAGITVLQID